MEKIVSRVVILWVTMIFITIGLLYNKMNEEAMLFYQFGPSSNLMVFGLNIDTYTKYVIIVISVHEYVIIITVIIVIIILFCYFITIIILY